MSNPAPTSISSEAGSFGNYSKWLNHKTSANKVIYSTVDVWSTLPLFNVLKYFLSLIQRYFHYRLRRIAISKNFTMFIS